MDAYEVQLRKDKRGVDLISDALPFGRLWYTKPDDAVEYAKFYSRSRHAVIRVYDAAGNVIETRGARVSISKLRDFLSHTSRRGFSDALNRAIVPDG
jgi:hypothetical protein